MRERDGASIVFYFRSVFPSPDFTISIFKRSLSIAQKSIVYGSYRDFSNPAVRTLINLLFEIKNSCVKKGPTNLPKQTNKSHIFGGYSPEK